MLDTEQIGLHKYVAPMFKTPFTDLFHQIRNLQCLKECAQYELLLVDCMEAYGYDRGKEKCRLLIQDMYECAMNIKKLRRVCVMQNERDRQFSSGERTQHYAETPPLDLF